MVDKVLLVEDDPLIVRTLTELLSGEGYEVEWADTERGALELIARAARLASCPYVLALLDVTLAQGTGFHVCEGLKALLPQVPAIFLTASDDEFNTVMGLEMGADDYIAKPFRARELLARIEAARRRSRPAARIVRFGPIDIDIDCGAASRDGKKLDLSAVEYRLLLLFANRQGEVVSREQIRDLLWDNGAGAYVEENTVSVYVKRLRDKLGCAEDGGELIKTVRGIGYRAGV